MKSKSIFTFIYITMIASSLTTLIFYQYNHSYNKLKNKNSEFKDSKMSFFTCVDNMYSIDSLNLFLIIKNKDLKDIFFSIDRECNNCLSNYGFVNLLQDYHHNYIEHGTSTSLFKIFFIRSVIDRELKEEPFESLNPDQRRVMKNLEMSITTGDSLKAAYNLEQLNDILKKENNEIKKLDEQNSLSLPIGIIGLISTFLFGIIGLYAQYGKSIKHYFTNQKSEINPNN